MSWFIALVVGIGLVLVAYYVAPLPAPVRMICYILGWLLVVVGIILVLALLFHIPLGVPAG